MTTGSLCLTEILMSRKSCSSNSEHSQSADSTSASGVALPYFASNRLSREPALTPIRIGVPASLAARAISPTLSSNALMLPGFTRTAAQPASMAANTYLGWKWMSAMTGNWDFFAMTASASASSLVGTATRTIWQPDAVNSAICCSVALMSAVTVVVIDCTDTGESLPTPTPPTSSCRVTRRGASTGTTRSAGMLGRPRPISGAGPDADPAGAVTDMSCRLLSRFWFGGLPASAEDLDRVDDVGHQGQRGQPDEQQCHDVGHRHQLGHVERARVGLVPEFRPALADPFDHRAEDVTAVQRQQRQHVQQEQRHVEPRDQVQEQHQLVLAAGVRFQDFPADPAGPDDADGGVDVPRRTVDDGVPQRRDPRRDGHDGLRRCADIVAGPADGRAETLRGVRAGG